MKTNQFKKWKNDKDYLKRQKEKRELIFKILCVVAFIIGMYKGSVVFNSNIEPFLSSYKIEEQKEHPDQFPSYSAYERSFKQSNPDLFK